MENASKTAFHRFRLSLAGGDDDTQSDGALKIKNSKMTGEIWQKLYNEVRGDEILVMTNARGSIGFKPIIAVLLVAAGFSGVAYYFSLEFSEMSSQLSTLEKQLDSASNERDLLRRGVRAAVENSRLLETDLDLTGEKFSESLKSALSKEERLIQENRSFLERLNTSLTELAAAVDQEKAAHEVTASEIMEQVESSRQQIESFQPRFATLGEEIEELGQELNRRFDRHSENDRQTLESISESQEELKDQVRQIVEGLRSEMSLVETEMERLEARMDDLKREIDRLESRGQQ